MCRDFNEAFYNMPAATVVLLQRQALYVDDIDMMHLSEIEAIDNKEPAPAAVKG